MTVLEQTFEQIKDSWDNDFTSEFHVDKDRIEIELDNRKLYSIDLRFTGLDEAVEPDNIENVKQEILDWIKAFGRTRILGRGTSGVFLLRVEV